MGVDLHGGLRIGVASQFLHDPGVNTIEREHGEIRVSELVEGHAIQAECLAIILPPLAEGCGVETAARDVHDDGALVRELDLHSVRVAMLPAVAVQLGDALLLELAQDMECRSDELGHGQKALSHLGLGRLEVVEHVDRVADVDGTLLEVHVAPREAANLAPAKPHATGMCEVARIPR